MSWFAQNKFMAGFLVVIVLAIGGAGYYLGQGLGKFNGSMNEFKTESNRLLALKRKPLFPNEENVGRIRDSVTEYKGAVNGLQQALLKFQKPLNNDIKDSQFPQLLKRRIESFTSVAATAGMRLPEDFYMGFPEYRTEYPEPAAVGLLDFQLKAIESFMLMLVSEGVEEVNAIVRARLPIEGDDFEAPETPEVLEKYRVELTVTGSHEAIRGFFNRISNDQEYFSMIRFVRIENSAMEGPLRDSGASDIRIGGDDFADDPNVGFADDPEGEGYDATIIMGQEKIRVYMVIDVVRFVEIESEESGEAAAN